MSRSTLAFALLAASATTASSAADTRLTVYSGDYDAVVASASAPGMPGYALVRQSVEPTRTAQGESTVTGLPVAIDAAGIRITPTPSGQRFDFGAGDQSEILRRAIGRRVNVVQAVGNESRNVSGTLVAVGEGLTVQDERGQVVVLSDYASFTLDSLPAGVHALPTLGFQGDGTGEVVLDYPTGGLAWRAEYVATLEGDCRMDFSGAAQVANRSGADFDDAAVTLVAGQPNLQPVAGAPQPMMFKAESRARVADAAPQPVASGEYHAYALPGRIDLPQASVQRVPLLDAARGVPCTRRYEARSPMGYFRPGAPIIDPGFGPEGDVPVMATLAFANRKAERLGVPLPAGRLRVFDGDAFLGEAAIAHTPAGKEVQADLGQAFDLTLTRTRKDLVVADDRLSLVERIELVLRNAKATDAVVRVHEAMPRWTEWEIVESDATWERRDAQTAIADVRVPAGGEATVAYAVRYRWPESVRP